MPISTTVIETYKERFQHFSKYITNCYIVIVCSYYYYVMWFICLDLSYSFIPRYLEYCYDMIDLDDQSNLLIAESTKVY